MISKCTFQLPSSPVQCNTAPLYWEQTSPESFHNNHEAVPGNQHCGPSQSTSGQSHPLNLDDIQQTKPIPRSEFIEHNARMIAADRRHELWTVDTKRIYHGRAIYCFLKPFILANIRDNDICETNDDREKSQIDLNSCGQRDAHVCSNAAVPKKCRQVTCRVDETLTNNHNIVNNTTHNVLYNEVNGAVVNHEETGTSEFNVSDNLCTRNQHTQEARTEHIEERDKTPKKLLIAEQKKLRDRPILVKKQKLTQRHIEENQPYNKIFHYLSIFRLSREIIQAAKDATTIGDVIDDPLLQEADKHDMKNIEPYLLDIRETIAEYKTTDEAFDQALRSITRSQFIEHNQKLLKLGGRDKLWTIDARRVYHGRDLYNRSVSLIKRYDRSALDKILHSSKHQRGLWHCSYGMAFQFISKFHVPQREMDRIKRQVAIGRLTDDPDTDIINQHDTQLLLDEITTENISEILSDFAKCVLRHSMRITQGKQYNSWSGDINQLEFPMPEDVDLTVFRRWPDYIWHDRDMERRWIDDWTSGDEYTKDGPTESLFSDSDEQPSASWRDAWEPFDTDIAGEVAWEVLSGDVIENDDATETQIITMLKRAAKPSHRHPKWMAKRRAELTQYFIANSRNTEDELEPYTDWADKMQMEWNIFQETCTIWQHGYVQPRPSYQEPPIPVQWQRFLGPIQNHARHEKMLLYFKNHRFVTKCDLESYRSWHENMKNDWERFLLVCETWSPDDIPNRYRQHK